MGCLSGESAQQHALLSSSSSAGHGLVPVPEPPGLPILGHLRSIDRDCPVGSLQRLAEKHGPIYRLRVFSRTLLVISSYELVHEVCDDTRFRKWMQGGESTELREAVHDGLFTAKGEEEENWGIAHRILVSAFGPLAVRGMFGEMRDITSQLALKWARHGPRQAIELGDDLTRLVTDTVALCGMGFRLNSFYRSDGAHPFVRAVDEVLRTASDRTLRPPGLPGFLFRASDKRYTDNITVLRRTAEEVLRARKREVGGVQSASDGGYGGGDNDDDVSAANPAPPPRRDLLSAMLGGVDAKTGKSMSDESIIDNLISFFIAGHEATASTMSFVFYQLLTHPDAYRKAQDEVDAVVGKGQIQVEHIHKFKYLSAVIRETMRLSSPFPFISREAREDTVIGGRYAVRRGEQIASVLSVLHSDPEVYGAGAAAEFRPERMLDGAFDRLMREAPHAWLPFGTGPRACVGRQFAWQVMLLGLALLMQNFRFVMDDPAYTLRIAQTITIKPKDFRVRAVLRHGMTAEALEARLYGWGPAASAEKAGDDAGNGEGNSSSTGVSEKARGKAGTNSDDGDGRALLRPLTVLYGSNSGTCEFMARRLASHAPQHGFEATTVDVLDAATQALPKDRPVVIVTASYEGLPPHNAVHFVGWIRTLRRKNRPLKGVSYAVFGCGHRDWSQTFNRTSKLLDATLAHLGADRMARLTTTDAKERDTFADFEAWEDGVLWPAVKARYGRHDETRDAKKPPPATQTEAAGAEQLQLALSAPRAATLRHDVQEMEVVAARVMAYREDSEDDEDDAGPAVGQHTITDGDSHHFPYKIPRRRRSRRRRPAKCHLEVRLPPGVSYTTGDYLMVLPHNPPEVVARAMRRFGLARDAHVTLRGAQVAVAALPAGADLSVAELLGSYVELGEAAARKDILSLSRLAQDEAVRQRLRFLATDGYETDVKSKNLSVLAIAEAFPGLDLPFGTFLLMLPPMRLRQYSISSSPLADPSIASITYAVLDAPAWSGHGRHVGVASSYLVSLAPGDRVRAAVRHSSKFRLPEDLAHTPLVLVASGAGIAPFRAFVQERVELLRRHRREHGDEATATNPPVGPAALFYGCREPGDDELYRDELDAWQREGALSGGIHRAYSRVPHLSGGCRHAQDLMLAQERLMLEFWDLGMGGTVYACGSGAMTAGAAAAVLKVVEDRCEADGMLMEPEEMEEWMAVVGRCRVDVFY